jgi:hypothetical protein
VADRILIGHYTHRSGCVTDAAFAMTIDAGTDYVLNLSLKGTTVSASVKKAGAANWQGMAGHVFNAVTVDGDFGLLSRGSASSFDAVTVKTDDPAFRTPDDADAMTSGSSQIDPTEQLSDLIYEDLDPIIDAAVNRWLDSTLFDAAMLNRLDGVTFLIADLEGDALALTVDDTVIIDIDAAGRGWFIDDTPYQDTEFIPQGNDEVLEAGENSAAFGDMDLLTVVMHELGHVFGYRDMDPATNDAEIMNETLDEGVRYLPEGTFNDRTPGGAGDLVALDLTPEEGAAEEALDALVNANPWLIKFLLDGADDAVDPNAAIALVVNDDDAGSGDAAPVAPDTKVKGKKN